MPIRLATIHSAVALAACVIILGGPAAADIEAGRKAFQAKDYATALKQFKAAGAAGDAQALFYAGQMLALGEGVPKDMPAGLALMEQAAAAGHIQAMVTAGTAYAYADGVPADYAKAFRLLEPAARAGDVHAQNNVAVLYHFGLGTSPDQVRAMAWALRAERQGLLQAINLRQEIEAGLTLAQKSEAMKLAAMPLTGPAARPPQPSAVAAAAPVPAPAQSVSVPQAPVQTAVQPADLQPPSEPPPATAPSGGGWTVQLAALPDRAEAEKQWRAIAQRRASLLNGMTPTFADADLGEKGIFTRILVGNYPSRGEAEAFCAQLKQAGQDCLIRRR